MRVVRLCRLGLAAAVAVLVATAGGPQAWVQDRSKIEVVPAVGHSGGTTSATFSPDGTLVASGGNDNTVRLWQVSSGRLVRTFQGHTDGVRYVSFSPDGRQLASASEDHTLKLWDTASGALLRTLEGHLGAVRSVLFSPNGAHVLSGADDKTIRLWDTSTGVLVRVFEGHTDGIKAVAFSSDGARLLSGSWDKTARLWDAASGALVRTFEGHGDGVRSVAFSPDAKLFVSASEDNTVRLWDTTSGALLRVLMGHSGAVRSVAFSPDGNQVVSGSADKSLRLWDAASGRLLHTFNGHTDGVWSVAFSPDGQHLLSGAWDSTLRRWDPKSGALLQTLEGRASAIRSVAFSPDAGQLASASEDNTVNLWDAASGILVRIFKGHTGAVRSVAFSPDGKWLASGSEDKRIKVWNVATGSNVATLEGHTDGLWSVTFSPNGRYLLSGSWDKTARLWEAASGALVRTFEGHGGGVRSVAFSPDGKRFASAGEDNTVRLWDTSGALLLTLSGHVGAVRSVAFSPDGDQVASGSADKSVRLWDAASGRLLRTLEGHTDGVWSVNFFPDGRHLLSGAWDGTLRLWDPTSGALLRTFEGHSGAVRSVAVSGDRRRIASGGYDGTTRIWYASPHEATGSHSLLAILMAGDRGQWLAMTPAGFFAASRKGTDMLSVVRGLDAYSAMQFYDHLHRPDLVEELLKGDPEGKYKDASRRLNLETILDSGPTPRIELLPNRTQKSGETVKLAARLIDEGGGIGKKVLWRVNGKTLGATAPPGLTGPPTVGEHVVMEQTLTVDPSKTNEVEIIATNGKGLLATPPLHFEIDAWGPVLQERSRLFVLAIAVDKYLKQDWQLRYAVKDASAFAVALKAVGSAKIGGRPLFADIEVKTLIDAEVTERSIAAEFERLSKGVKARDVFVLFLGGHGRSIAGEGWFYIPQDLDLGKGHTIERNAIGPGRLRDWLAKVPAEKSLIVLDACESGASEAFRGGDRVHETVIAQLEHATGRNTIAAAPAGKAAYEGYNGHGVLTYAILEALHRPEGAPADAVSVFDIAKHVSLQVPAISQATFGFRQQPRFTPTGDDFSLGLRQAVLKGHPLPILLAPTHTTTTALKVYKEAGGKGGVVHELKRNAGVTLLESERGWARIAREGKALGYVPERRLQKVE